MRYLHVDFEAGANVCSTTVKHAMYRKRIATSPVTTRAEESEIES
jgi:hypothetical protein